jgi:hypothetical protein
MRFARTGEIGSVSHHGALRKNRPVMPWGMRRSKTTANANMAISPITGVEPKDTTWLMVPKITELDKVPVMTAAPPVMTVMKALAM